ncbi:MAG TPA: class I SAM-dependent methyltransferase [Turneriella sp.]|nr:class I SAM-dependent methyltransferase [Turneriella sp.]
MPHFFNFGHETMNDLQNFKNHPTEIRETNHYQQEYISQFVQKWDELINWEARSKSEGDFFIRSLKKFDAKRILDVATGTGYHSVMLLNAGFEVTSVDGNPEMLARAFTNARKHGHILKTIHADWRWLNRDVHEKYDAIICLGNSFTHLFSERERRKALAEFNAALRHNGVLIIDQRNYDSIIDQGYNSKHAYYYLGQNVKAEPEYVDAGLARFKYEFLDGSIFHLNMYPLRRQYMRRLLLEVGFQRVVTYGDFQASFDKDDPDFLVHIAEKKFIENEPELESEDNSKIEREDD